MEQYIELICVPMMTSVIYTLISVLKHAFKSSEIFERLIPLLALLFGSVIGVILYFIMPEMLMAENIFIAILMGAASGLSSIGFSQMIKQIPAGKKKKNIHNNESEIEPKISKFEDVLLYDIIEQNNIKKTSEIISNNYNRNLSCKINNESIIKDAIIDEIKLQIVQDAKEETAEKHKTKMLAKEIKNQIMQEIADDK